MATDTFAAILGVLISCLASSASAFANVLIRWSHLNNEKKPVAEQRAVLKRCHIYPIISLYIVNGLLDMAAFSLAPMSLLAPTSALTIVINGVAARAILGEVMTQVDLIGSGIIFVGAVLCTVFGSKESEQRSAEELKSLYERDAFIVFAVIDACLLTLCLCASLVIFPRVLGVPGLCYHPPKQMDEAAVLPDKSLTDKEKAAAEEARQQVRERERRELRTNKTLSYGVWALSFATLTAGVASWTNIFLKSFIEMVVVTFDGNNQLEDGVFWLLLGGLTVSAAMQGTFTAKLMEPFEAIFIVPVFQVGDPCMANVDDL